MLKSYLLAGLAGFGLGAAIGLYLLLMLHVIAAARGLRRNLLVYSWPLHAAVPALLTFFLVLPQVARLGGRAVNCFMLSWALPLGACSVWYLATHPDPIKPELRKRGK